MPPASDQNESFLQKMHFIQPMTTNFMTHFSPICIEEDRSLFNWITARFYRLDQRQLQFWWTAEDREQAYLLEPAYRRV